MTNEPSKAEMRRAFEEWYEADAMPMESDWFRRDPSEPDEYDQAITAVSYRAYRAAFAAGRASVPREGLREQLEQAYRNGAAGRKCYCGALILGKGGQTGHHCGDCNSAIGSM